MDNNIKINFFTTTEEMTDIVNYMLDKELENNKNNKFKIGEQVRVEATFNELYNLFKINETPADARKIVYSILNERYGIIQGSNYIDDMGICYMVSFLSHAILPIPEKFLQKA